MSTLKDLALTIKDEDEYIRIVRILFPNYPEHYYHNHRLILQYFKTVKPIHGDLYEEGNYIEINKHGFPGYTNGNCEIPYTIDEPEWRELLSLKVISLNKDYSVAKQVCMCIHFMTFLGLDEHFVNWQNEI